MKRIILFYTLTFLSLISVAQPHEDFLQTPVCWDSAGTTIQLYAVNYHSTNDVSRGIHTGLFNIYGEKQTGISTSNLTAGACCSGSVTTSQQYIFYRNGTCSDTLFISENQDSFVVFNGNREILNINDHNLTFRPGEIIYPIAIDTFGNIHRASTGGNGDTLHTAFLLGVIDENTICVTQDGFFDFSYPHGYELGKIHYVQDSAGYATVPDNDFVDDAFIPYTETQILLQDIRPFSNLDSGSVGDTTTTENLTIDTFAYVLSNDSLNRAGFRYNDDARYTVQFGNEYSYLHQVDSTDIVARSGLDEARISLNRYETTFDSGLRYLRWKNIIADYSLTQSDYAVKAKSLIQDIVIELPVASNNLGKEYVIWNDNAFNVLRTVRLTSEGGLINRGLTYTLQAGECIILQSENNEWRVVKSGNRYLRDEGNRSYAGFKTQTIFEVAVPDGITQDVEDVFIISNNRILGKLYDNDSTRYSYHDQNLDGIRFGLDVLNSSTGDTITNSSLELDEKVLFQNAGKRNRIRRLNSGLSNLISPIDNTIIIDAENFDVTGVLPNQLSDAVNDGLEFTIQATNNNNNSASISVGGTTTIDGENEITLGLEETIIIFYDADKDEYQFKSRTKYLVTDPILIENSSVELSTGVTSYFMRCPFDWVGREVVNIEYAVHTASTMANTVAAFSVFTRFNGNDKFGVTFFGEDISKADTDAHVLSENDLIEFRVLQINGSDLGEGLQAVFTIK